MRTGTERQQNLKFTLYMLPLLAVSQLVGGGIPQGEGEWTRFTGVALLGAVLASAVFHLLGIIGQQFRSRHCP